MTREASCVLCRRRKVRCDKTNPCSNCTRAQVKCQFALPSAARSRTKGTVDRDLIERIRRYEEIFEQHGIDIEAVREDLRIDHRRHVGSDEGVEEGLGQLGISTNTMSKPVKTEDDDESVIAGSHLRSEFSVHEKLLSDSPEEEPTILLRRAFDQMFRNDGFGIVLGTQHVAVTLAHPSPVQIFRLWQVYIDNVNCLLKLHHVPTFQSQLLEAASDLANVTKEMEAVMFGIYLMAINSLEESEIVEMFASTKRQLLLHYHGAMQQALTNAGFLHQPHILTLQAYVLDLLATKTQMDPRQVFYLFGMAVRVAQQMGLHLDEPGFRPFEAEQRRRLWWTIVYYDRRLGEMIGSSTTAISSTGSAAVPLNVDDPNIYTHSITPPMVQDHPAEMTFALSRIELARTYIAESNQSQKMLKSGKVTNDSPGPIVRLLGRDPRQFTLHGYCEYIESTYLAHCDAEIPLHFFTQVMTRQALCRMRLLNLLARVKELSSTQRDEMFMHAVEMLEFDNTVQSSEGLRRFRWYAADHLPVAANMFLARELLQRSTGNSVDRAWEAISKHHDLRGLRRNRHSPMYTTYINHLQKAWASRKMAQVHPDTCITSAGFLEAMQDRKEELGRDKPSGGAEAEKPAAPADVMVGGQSTDSDGLRRVYPAYGIAAPEDDDMDWIGLLRTQPGMLGPGGFEDAGFYEFGTMPENDNDDMGLEESYVKMSD